MVPYNIAVEDGRQKQDKYKTKMIGVLSDSVWLQSKRHCD